MQQLELFAGARDCAGHGSAVMNDKSGKWDCLSCGRQCHNQQLENPGIFNCGMKAGKWYAEEAKKAAAVAMGRDPYVESRRARFVAAGGNPSPIWFEAVRQQWQAWADQAAEWEAEEAAEEAEAVDWSAIVAADRAAAAA